MNNYIDELRELAKLKDEGIITDNEFQQKKEKLLSENLETSTIKTESDVQSKKEEISPNIVDSDKKTEFSKLKKPNSKEWLKKISKVDEVDEVNEKSINKSNKSNSHIKSEWGFRFIIFSFILSGFLSFYVHKSFFLILMIISPILVIMLLRKFGITGQNVKNKKIIKSGNTKYKKGQKNTRIILGGFGLIFLLWIIGTFNVGGKKAYRTKTEDDVRKAILQTTWYGTIRQYNGEQVVKYVFSEGGTWKKYTAMIAKGYNKSSWEFDESGRWKTWYNLSGRKFVGVDMYPNKMRGLYRMDSSDQLYNSSNTPTCYSKEWYGKDSRIGKEIGW